jgi:hypothetical protein
MPEWMWMPHELGDIDAFAPPEHAVSTPERE